MKPCAYFMGYTVPDLYAPSIPIPVQYSELSELSLQRLWLYWLAVNLAACGSWRLEVLPLAPSYIDDCFMVWPLLKRIVNWPNCLSRSSAYILALCFFCAVSITFWFEYSAHEIWIHTLVKHMSLWLTIKNLFWDSVNDVSFCVIVMVCRLVHGQLMPLLQRLAKPALKIEYRPVTMPKLNSGI